MTSRDDDSFQVSTNKYMNKLKVKAIIMWQIFPTITQVIKNVYLDTKLKAECIQSKTYTSVIWKI